MTPACTQTFVTAVAPYGPEGRGAGLWALTVENPGWNAVSPGQFAMLRPPAWGFDPLWARPFSICRARPEGITFLVQVVGRGTAGLVALRPGEPVTLWGPLGRGFAVEPDRPTLVVAGGIGLAPFVEYVETHPTPKTVSLLFGHRLPLSAYPFERLAGLVGSAQSFQDHGPEDIPQFVALVRQAMAAHAAGLVVSCGPTPLLRVVQASARELGVRAQISLENRMACGVGACLGCVAKDDTGHYVQTCTQGPVFWSDTVAL